MSAPTIVRDLVIAHKRHSICPEWPAHLRAWPGEPGTGTGPAKTIARGLSGEQASRLASVSRTAPGVSVPKFDEPYQCHQITPLAIRLTNMRPDKVVLALHFHDREDKSGFHKPGPTFGRR
jgi:hypothetical protein